MVVSFPLITCTIAALLLGGLLVALLPRGKGGNASKLQIGTTSATMIVALLCAVQALFSFDVQNGGTVQFLERFGWIPSSGVFYAVGADGLSLSLWLLSVFVTSGVIGWTILSTQPKAAMLVSILVLTAAVIGCFVAQDLVLFFVFFELMLFPSYVLLTAFGTREVEASARPRSLFSGSPAMLFILYTALAGACMLAGIIAIGSLQVTTGEPSFGYEELALVAPRAPLWIVSLFALAFGIKSALVPLHGWLVHTYEKAPMQATIIFAALLSKVGLYGLLRICGGIFHETFADIQGIIFILGVVGILYGALLALAQLNLRRLLAYSSLSHLGFCFVGIGAGTIASLTGAAFQMINHGITVAALFMIVWALEQRSVDLRFDATHGLAARVPWIAGYFLIFILSSIALPLTNNFVGEFLILSGAMTQDVLLTVLATLGVIVGAIYMLNAANKLLHGKLAEAKDGGILDLRFKEKILLLPFVVLIFVLGVKPQAVLNLLSTSVMTFSKEGPPASDLTLEVVPTQPEESPQSDVVGTAYKAGIKFGSKGQV